MAHAKVEGTNATRGVGHEGFPLILIRLVMKVAIDMETNNRTHILKT